MAELTVIGDNQWFGDPRLGSFTVYVDGIKRGRVSPDMSLLIACQPGRHVVRVRQWWYMSARIDIDMQPEQQMALKGGFNQTGNFVSRMFTGVFLPWRAMTLAPSSGRPVTRNYSAQARPTRVWLLLGMLAALVLVLVGVDTSNVALMSIGGAGFFLSQGLAIRQGREFRRHGK